MCCPRPSKAKRSPNAVGSGPYTHTVRVVMVVNPFASSVTARNRVVIQKAISADHDLTVLETSRRSHATRFAQDAAQRGADVVVALGGDGTINEVANGLAGTDCALAPLPGGSTNVFSRTIGMPNDPVEATAVLVDALERGSMRRVGLGSANGRFFLFHTGVGFDAAVVRAVEKRGDIKRWAGHPLFIYAALRQWFGGYDRRRPHFVVHLGETPPIPGGFAVVLNTNPYTYLGNRPFDLAPAASLDNGLSLVVFRELHTVAFLRALAATVRGSGVAASRSIARHDDLTEFAIDAVTDGVPFQVDGDDLGDAHRLTFRHHPEVLLLVLP